MLKVFQKLVIQSGLLAVLLAGSLPAVYALPEYTQREQKACSYCHTSATPGAKDPATGEKQTATCNSRGNYYAAHNHTFEGYKIETNAPKIAPSIAFQFVWKEEFADLPRRIGVGDVTGDGVPRLVMLHEKPDSKTTSRLTVRKWDGKTFVKEFEADAQSLPDKLQVGKFAGPDKPAVILTADALWAWNGKTFERKPAAKTMNLFGNTRLKNGQERVLIASNATDIKAYKINPNGTSGDFLTDGIEMPNSSGILWGDMHASPAFFSEMGFPELLSEGGVVGLWDARKNNTIALYYEKVARDFDVKQGSTKPEFVAKSQQYYLVLADPKVGTAAEIWTSPPLPAPLLDVRTEDARGSTAVGLLFLLGEPGKDKHRLLAFVALVK